MVIAKDVIYTKCTERLRKGPLRLCLDDEIPLPPKLLQR
jgi:hypothetical protein